MNDGLELITELVAICVDEPNGAGGLDGFKREAIYRCQFIEGDFPRYYRIYPVKGEPEYVCAIPRLVGRFFRIEEVAG